MLKLGSNTAVVCCLKNNQTVPASLTAYETLTYYDCVWSRYSIDDMGLHLMICDYHFSP